jgi:WD40 repeat protein
MLTGFSIRRDFRISPSASVQQWQWDLRTAQFQILKEIPPHLAPRKSSASSQRGDLVASIGGNNVSVSKRGDPKGPYLTFRWLSYLFVAFTSEDTRLIAVAGPDPFGARMWDLEPNAEPLFFKSGKANIFSAAVSRDGAYLALGDRDGYISMWPLWKAAADELCARVTRNLSMEEWRRYVGESIPYERTCPELPAGTRAH